jgi:glycosyltransferase involved in cell wall biosynthesis
MMELQPAESQTSLPIPLVSVVVIGRNEGARLTRCLAAIHSMERSDFRTEVLYVDSQSTDGSPGLAQAMGSIVIELPAGATTAARGRNAGWRAARGSFILFLDGDTELHPDFAGAALDAMNDPAVAIVWGHRRETATSASLYNRVLDLDWIYPAGESTFCGGDALFRRQALERTGGFDDALIAGEEPELCRRITAGGQRILHLDQPMTGHDLAMTRFGQYWRRATRAGHAFAEVSERFRHTPDPFWLADSRRNLVRAGILLSVFIAAVLVSLLGKTLLPLAILCLLMLALVLRTAWKARWKSADALTLVLYGLHSHAQQIPILFGQMQYRLNRRAGRRAGLVEYKSS